MAAVSFFTWIEENTYWDDMLEQERFLADYYPRNPTDRPEPRPFRSSVAKYMSQEVMDAAVKQYHTVQQLPGWRDQRKVANWALGILNDRWHIHVLHDADNIPLYYFIMQVIDENNIEMRGLWRSIYGSLYYLSHGKPVVKGLAMDLVKWAFKQHNISNDAHVDVNAQLGLVKLFDRNGIKLPFLAPFQTDVQGVSEWTFFTVSQLYE